MMDANVYLGVWTNWSRGPVFGRTLTTTKEYGNILIAFTAFFVAFVASRFWGIVCLIIHRCYSTSESRDTIHHQRQVILRNSSTAESGIWALVCVLYAWRRSPWKTLLRLLPPLLVAICSLVGFTIAGGFSASITTAVGDEVLLKSVRCGIIYVTENITDSGRAAATITDKLNYAANYAQQCYSLDTPGGLDCNRFVVKRLPTEITDFNASCPFQEQICRNPNTNIRLDTGYIDSNDHLGLNYPERQRLAWRYVLHCAPLKTDGYLDHRVRKETNETTVRYYYGSRNIGRSDSSSPNTTDFLYETYGLESQYPTENLREMSGRNFRALSSHLYQGQDMEADFFPISELSRPDGDITVIFLSGDGVRFLQPAYDEWYRGTVPYQDLISAQTGQRTTGYRPEEAASPMGCVEQWQWCNRAYPLETGCGPLAGMYDAFLNATYLFNTTAEVVLDSYEQPSSSMGGPETRISWLGSMLHVNSGRLGGVITHLGAKSLLSQVRLWSGIQVAIPDNQWQLDVVHWWSTILASVQASSVHTVQNHNRPNQYSALRAPNNTEERRMCDSQKIRSTAYTSFSLFGLYFTFITGAIITIISYIAEPVLSWLHKHRKYGQYAHLEWASNTSLQLHRLAHENVESGEWSNCTDTIPTNDHDAHLASLNITDLKHPVLNRPSSTSMSPKPEQVGPPSSQSIDDITQVPTSTSEVEIESEIEGGLQAVQRYSTRNSTSSSTMTIYEGDQHYYMEERT